MKNIWIFNHYALTPDMSGGTRHFDFAVELVKRGYSVTIFASSFHYSQYKELKSYKDTFYVKEERDGVDFIWLKTRPYVGNGIGRVINMLDYMNKVQQVIGNVEEEPDLVIGSSVHLFAVYAAYKVAKRKQVPFVMEVRDIWPQTLIDMGISKWHPFIVLLGILEKFLYKKADKIISNLPYAYEHIGKFGVKKEDFFWISNGVDIERSKRIKAYEYEKNKLHITYAGAVGQANQLETLVQAAAVLEDNEKVVFHVIGSGPLLKDLEKMKTSNVILHGSLPKEKAISMIKGADVLFFPLADSPVFRFGISSNKLFDYLASKNPIIFASNASNNPVKEANAGISIKAESVEEVISAVNTLMDMDQKERQKLGENGYNYVAKNFSIPALVDKLEVCISSLVYNVSKKEQ